MARKYFGTDGVRGKVGEPPITPDFVMRLGYAVGSCGGARCQGWRCTACGADRQGHARVGLHARGSPPGGLHCRRCERAA